MSRFERAMKVMAVHEGGFADNPKDPGGRTNRGVTQRTYDAHRKRMGQPRKDVKNITDAEVSQIYREQYWNAVRADDLPSGVGYMVFDAAVNSGPSRAAKWLQAVVGTAEDGVVGDQTIAAIGNLPLVILIDAYCDKRLAFMKSLKHWPTFKNGWARRVAEVRAQAKAWAKGKDVPQSSAAQQPKATGDKSAAGTLKDVLGDPSAVGAAGGLLGSAGALLGGDGPVQYALAALLVLGALVGIWWMVKGRHAE